MDHRRPLTVTSLVALLLVLLVAGPAVADTPAKSDDAKEKKKAASSEGAAAADTEAPKAKPVSPFMAAVRTPAPDDSAEVITNEDLEKLSGGGVYVVNPAVRPGSESAAELTEEDGPEGVDPLEWLEQQRQAAAEREKSRRASGERVSELEQKVADLESRLRKIRNPLLGAPSVPADDERPEGAAPWSELGAAERAAETQAAIAAARAELAEARAAGGDR